MLIRSNPFIILAMVFSLFSAQLFAEENDIITSAAEINYPPFSITNPAGEADGFSVELLRASLSALNRDVSFRTGTWAEVKNLLEKGEIKALPLVGRTPEREKVLDFTIPYMTLHGAIVVRDETENITSLNDLQGKKVAVMKMDNTEEFLKRKKLDIELISTPTFDDALKGLSKGVYDAVVIQRLVAIRLIKENNLTNLKIIKNPIMEFNQDFCFAVKEGDRETLSLLNEGLSIVIADGTYRYLHSKWFASLEIPDDRKIVIGGDYNFPPFEFLDKNGRPAGFNVDITRAIAEETGLNIEIKLAPWTEITEDLKQGRIDVIQGMFYSPFRDLKYDFSLPHSNVHHISVVRKGESVPPSTIGELEGKNIAVQNGDIMHDFLLSQGLRKNITAFETPEDALKELSLGKADCALLTRVTAIYLIKKNGWSNLEIAKKPILTTEYCYATLKGHRPLLTVFTEGLKSIEENGEYRRIHEKWMGIYSEGSLPFSLIKRYAVIVFLPLLIILFISFFWTWSLRRLVARKTAELRQSESQFRSIVEAVPDSVFVHSNYLFSYLNASACRLFGIYSPKQLIGKPVMDRFHPSTYEIAKKRIKAIYEQKEYMPLLEQKYLRTDGSEVPVEVSAVPIIYEGKESALVFVRDITSLKEIEQEQAVAAKKREALESQLRQAQKIESVGRLAGGVAHDYNNMLSVINGYTELAMDKVGPSDPIFAYLKEIYSAGTRSADITKQLLAFARKQTINPRVINLNIAVESMLNTIRRLIGESIVLDWYPSSDIWMIKMDSSQIDQILVNLCINARDAITDIGRITIETSNIVIDDEYCADHRGFIPGKFVLLTVSDNGNGMDKKTLEFIFEPFFTTKTLGLGTGLGLSTVYGIVKQNNGFINVYSESEKGSTFKIYIPRYTDQLIKNESDDIHEAPTGTGETVLIVEDELSILNLTGKMIEKLGYNVLTSASPYDALKLAESHKDRINLLITDVVMPEMNGRNMAEKIQEIFPDIKVLYMSGYTANVIAHQGVLEEGVSFIQKPFSINELGIKIMEALQKD